MPHQLFPNFRRAALYLTQPKVALFVIEACILVALVSVTLGERAVIAADRHVMPAGDVFNYQSIARSLRYFDYPTLEKRLPGYPLALLVGIGLGFDPTNTGVAVSILSSAAATAVLYLLGRHFRLPMLPLAAVLLLTSVAPLLTINGVRPLADSYFMFLTILAVYVATVARPTRRWAIAVGLVMLLLAFTRYEGVPTALFMLFLLCFRFPWRLVLIACAPLLIGGLLWIPVAHKVYGSLENFGYYQDAQKNADWATFPAEYMRVVKSSGFGKAWAIQELWAKDAEAQKDAQALLYSPNWWLSVLASFGVIWLLIWGKKKALPVIITFILYPVLPAFWFLYSRYVAPMSAFYFFAAAAGAAGVWTLVSLLLHRLPRLRPVAAVLLTALLVKMVLGVAPGQYKEAMVRGWENNGNGYAQYRALLSLKDRPDRVAVTFDYLMATLMLGSAPPDGSPRNPGRGIYLSAKPEASPAQLADYLREKETNILVDSGEKELVPLVAYLRARNHIKTGATETFFWTRQDKDVERTYLYHLQWPR